MTMSDWKPTYKKGDHVRSLVTPAGRTYGGLIVEGSRGEVVDQLTPDLVAVFFDGAEYYVYMTPEQIEKVVE